jgi:hypothetical protein
MAAPRLPGVRRTPVRSASKVKSARHIHHVEHKWVVWNHGNWKKIDKLLKRRERKAQKQDWRRDEI